MNSRETDFVREYLGTNPPNGAEAYRRAYGYKGQNADILAFKLMQRPAVKATLEEAKAAAGADGVLDMRERRGFLAKVVRDKRRFPSPDAGTRINALREDAILAGERRTDGTQVSINGDVNLSIVLQSLRGGLATPDAIDLPAVGDGDVIELQGGAVAARQSHKLEVVGSIPTPAFAPNRPAGAVLGPLGPLRGTGRVRSGGGASDSLPAPYVCDE